MTTTTPGGRTDAPRRVRQQARDVVTLMAFSAGASLVVAVALALLVKAGG